MKHWITRKFISRCILVLFSALPLTAFAIPVTWTLSGVSFPGGGTLTGTFVYDRDTNTYSSINLMATGFPTPADNGSYTWSNCASYSCTDSLFAVLKDDPASSLVGKPEIFLTTVTQLTNAGGNMAINTVQLVNCTSSNCLTASLTATASPGGSLSGTSGTPIGTSQPVPTLSWPAMLALAAMLGGFAYTRRKQH